MAAKLRKISKLMDRAKFRPDAKNFKVAAVFKMASKIQKISKLMHFNQNWYTGKIGDSKFRHDKFQNGSQNTENLKID